MNKKNGLLPEKWIYIIVVLGLYVAYSLFLITYYPVYIDEVLTYNYFTSKGIYTSITQYPFPNNHILFSVITNLFNYLPFDPLVKLRLPNLFIGSVSSVIMYLLLRKNFNHKVAVLPHLLFSFSYAFTFYSVFARGYMLMIFFTLVCYWSIEQFREKEYDKKYLWIYSLFNYFRVLYHPRLLICFRFFRTLSFVFVLYSKKNT